MRVAKAFATVLVALATLRQTLAVDVGSCEEFEAVDRKTETEVTITNADFQCDEYTRLSIRSEMVLKSTVGAVTFSNLALKIYGSLTVEPDVTFTGITDVDHNGGALKLELGAVGVFQGTANFTDVSILPVNTGLRRFVKGAAIHSKGALTFEKDATFLRCFNGKFDGSVFDDDASSGGGGAVYHHAKGAMHFMGKLTMIDNEADIEFAADRGEGGGIYNRGEVVVDGEAYFGDNRGNDGGAIFQERFAVFVFNSFATFEGNVALNKLGGAVFNANGYMAFKNGSLFNENSAASNGDAGDGGAIYNFDGGEITLEGPTAFTNNFATRAAGIYSIITLSESSSRTFEEQNGREYRPAVISFPDDTVFQDNDAEFCVDISFSQEDCS